MTRSYQCMPWDVLSQYYYGTSFTYPTHLASLYCEKPANEKKLTFDKRILQISRLTMRFTVFLSVLSLTLYSLLHFKSAGKTSILFLCLLFFDVLFSFQLRQQLCTLPQSVRRWVGRVSDCNLLAQLGACELVNIFQKLCKEKIDVEHLTTLYRFHLLHIDCTMITYGTTG